MVRTATSYSRQGVRDWIVQRVSAVVLAAYSLFILGFFLFTPQMTFDVWHGLFAMVWVKVFTLLTLLCLLVHAWIGIWTVLTDYIKCAALRLLLEVAVVLASVCYFIWGFQILWSVS